MAGPLGLNMPNAMNAPSGQGFSPLGGQPTGQATNVNDPQEAMLRFQQQLQDPQFQDFIAEQAAMEMEPPDLASLEQSQQLTQGIEQPMPPTGGAQGAPAPPQFDQLQGGFDPYMQILQTMQSTDFGGQGGGQNG